MDILQTALPNLQLVQPDIERDAPLGVRWLEGDVGRATLRLMGNNDEQNKPSTLAAEKARVKDFIESTEQLTWMIEFQDAIVGAVWVSLQATEYLAAPSIHIMISDPAARNHGIGHNTVTAVINYLQHNQQYDRLNSRHLTTNRAAERLLLATDFKNDGEAYEDSDGLDWQNMARRLG